VPLVACRKQTSAILVAIAQAFVTPLLSILLSGLVRAPLSHPLKIGAAYFIASAPSSEKRSYAAAFLTFSFRHCSNSS